MKIKVKNQFRDLPKFENIRDIIYNSKKLYGDNIAFVVKTVDENKNKNYRNYTYTDLINDVNAYGTALYDLGLKRKRIAIIGKNRYEWVIASLGNLFGGIVSVPLDKGLQVNELEDSLIRSKVDAIVFDPKVEEEIKTIKEKANTNVKHFICMEEFDGYININDLIKKGNEILKSGNDEYLKCEIDPDEMSILLFTSGTTSKSKAVMLNQRGIAANIHDMQIVENLLPTDTNIAFLPFHHIFGSTGMLVMLSRGVKTVFPDGLRYIKQNLQEYQVSVFVGVPLLVDKMYASIEKEIEKQGKTKLINFAIKLSKVFLKIHIDLRKILFKQVIDQLGGKLRFIISGGAPLDKRTAMKFNELGIHLVQGYGLTETSPVIAAENDYCVKPGSVGIPMKNMQVEIVNKDENGFGEIRVKGPNVMMGYYENQEVTDEVLKDGWFYTGDLGYFDEEGYLFITGREKDVIVLKNGKKVFPEELEILVNNLPEVEESFVYGMLQDDDVNNVKVSVEVVYAKDEVKHLYGDISEEDLHDKIWQKIKDINQTLPKYKYIKNLIVTDEELIKTTTNKIKRKLELEKIKNK